jgi:epoxyqueuosine reductase
MPKHRQLSAALIAEAEKWDGIRAGVAAIDSVLAGPSYKAAAGVNWEDDHYEQATPWLPNARSLLVLAMHHPEGDPRLDWFGRGNTPGNHRLTQISEALVAWLHRNHGINAQALPYQVERGGVYLKDAAVLAGLGVIGKNNLIVHPKWGPSVRLRSVLIEAPLSSSRPLEHFDPCHRCAMPCRDACPQSAFSQGQYYRPACIQRLDSDRGHPIDSGQRDSKGSPILVTEWCRRCEFACPVGAN